MVVAAAEEEGVALIRAATPMLQEMAVGAMATRNTHRVTITIITRAGILAARRTALTAMKWRGRRGLTRRDHAVAPNTTTIGEEV